MLLESHLAEIGISAEDFVEICMKAKASGSLNMAVVEQILAVEDFLSAYVLGRGARDEAVVVRRCLPIHGVIVRSHSLQEADDQAEPGAGGAGA